ncbi:MAG: hypothetical protein GX288_07580 [Clostridiales bacterium]|nr:hypothetical protein [Clostridiales bacterium]
MKIIYPVEAFALAMVVFSNNMENALLSGIIILFIATLGAVINHYIGIKIIPDWSRKPCNYILITAITYAVFQIVMGHIPGYSLEGASTLIQLAIGSLIAKYVIAIEGYEDFDKLLLEGASAYGALIIIGILREFMTEGSIFNNQLIKLGFMTVNFQNVAFGFMFAGIAIAILNRIFKADNKGIESLYVIVPAVLINHPFSIKALDNSLSILISILVAVIMLLSVRKTLTFSRVSKEFKHLPIELISVSAIYMILIAFKL